MHDELEIGDLFQTNDFAGGKIGKDAFADFVRLQHSCTQLHDHRDGPAYANRLIKSQISQIIEFKTYKDDPYKFMLAYIAALVAKKGENPDQSKKIIDLLRNHLLNNSGWIEQNPFDNNSNVMIGKSLTLFGSHLLRGENYYLPYLYDSKKRDRLFGLFESILVKVAGESASKIPSSEKIRFSTIISEAFTNCLIHAAQTKAGESGEEFLTERANIWALSFRRILLDHRQSKNDFENLLHRRFSWFPELLRNILKLDKDKLSCLIFVNVFDDGPGIVEHYQNSKGGKSPERKPEFVSELNKFFTSKRTSLRTPGAGKGCMDIMHKTTERGGQIGICTGPVICVTSDDQIKSLRISLASDDSMRRKFIGTNYLFVIPIFQQ